MHILNILSVKEKMAIKEPKYFIYENYYRRIGFPKRNSYYSMKHQREKDLPLLAIELIEQVPDTTDVKNMIKI